MKVTLHLFGSLATGLGLETSDMDLAIMGLNISDREVMVMKMHTLSTLLLETNYFQEVKPIETASVPVIKLVSDQREFSRAKSCARKPNSAS